MACNNTPSSCCHPPSSSSSPWSFTRISRGRKEEEEEELCCADNNNRRKEKRKKICQHRAVKGIDPVRKLEKVDTKISSIHYDFFWCYSAAIHKKFQTMSSPTIPQSSSSQTVTVVEPERLEAGATINRILVLKLRQKQKKITWTDDTVDNEHLGRKSSKRKIS